MSSTKKSKVIDFSQKIAWSLFIISCVGSLCGLMHTYISHTYSAISSWFCMIVTLVLGGVFLFWKKNYSVYSRVNILFSGFFAFPIIYLSFGGIYSSFSYYIFLIPVGYGLILNNAKEHYLQLINLIWLLVCMFISTKTNNMNILNATSFAFTFTIAWLLLFSITYLSAYSSRAVEANLIELYEHDELTGLKNRYFLEKERRLNDFTVVAMFDIDFFKRVNDKFLHSEGDKILQKFAQILKDIECDEIKVFRCGGEEFLLLSRMDVYITNEIIKEHVIDRVRNELRDPDGCPVTVSCGICFSEEKNIDKIKLADSYLYAAKFGGRDQVCFNGAKIY